MHGAIDCGRHFYGEECENRCSPHCTQGLQCYPTNGTCLYGCANIIDLRNDDWWVGDRCDVIVRKYTRRSLIIVSWLVMGIYFHFNFFLNSSAKDILHDIHIESNEPTEMTIRVTLNGNITNAAEQYIELSLSYFEIISSGMKLGKMVILNETTVTIPDLKSDTVYSVWVQAFRNISGERVESQLLKEIITTGKL